MLLDIDIRKDATKRELPEREDCSNQSAAFSLFKDSRHGISLRLGFHSSISTEVLVPSVPFLRYS